MTLVAVPSWQLPASSWSIPPSIWIKYDADRRTSCPRRRLFTLRREFLGLPGICRDFTRRDGQGYGVQSILLYFYFTFRGENQRSSRAAGIAVGCIRKGWVARMVAQRGRRQAASPDWTGYGVFRLVCYVSFSDLEDK
jgi:hypothetical protein